jgi:hypothetical protein
MAWCHSLLSHECTPGWLATLVQCTNHSAAAAAAACAQWYAWPEGYLGQSFNLSGKMEPRATALRDDIDKLEQFCQVRREESQFSEHTITSAEDAAMMVSAVVGADVDMGLLKAGGSASFEMYQVGGGGSFVMPRMPRNAMFGSALAASSHSKQWQRPRHTSLRCERRVNVAGTSYMHAAHS